MRQFVYKIHVGKPYPFGATCTSKGTNFAIYARESQHVTLILRTDSKRTEFVLDPDLHRTGHVWHVEVTPSCEGVAYLWRVGTEKDPRWISNECLDPWAKCLDSAIGAERFNDCTLESYSPWGVVQGVDEFDWQDVKRPKVKWEEMVVYEMHVRGFTKTVEGGTSGVAGTFLGIVEKIEYLKGLGVNVVELLPVMEFNEREWGEGKEGGVCLYWGYSTVGFFVPMNRYGKSDAVREFKYMVRELHKAGIEVVLDVVYNHTAEMGLDFVGRGFYGMKTLAPFSYYMLKGDGKVFVNHSGCGNTVNCNNPAVQEMICESLRYWGHEMGVDGFRFDLASILCRGTDGEPLERPPIIERISKDPTMRDIKLFAEPWDCGGLYQVGAFPHYGVWAEWNGKFRDCVRRFIKGDPGMIGEFATRLCGSQDLYGDGRRPFHSLNFVTAHDGFSLYDLVAYNNKHNHQNGENNNDGEAHNNSWNCGAEGETHDTGVNKLRQRQMRNMLVALLVAAGTPMLAMGDEYGHTQKGNNNGWCQDSELSWFNWAAAKADRYQMLRFTRKLVHLRRREKALQHTHFLSDRDISWHGSRAYHPEWNSGYNLLAMVFKGVCEIYVAFNAGGEKRTVELPRTHGGWKRIIDTNLDPPRDFADEGEETKLEGGGSYGMMPYSCVVLLQRGGESANPIESVVDMFANTSLKDM